MSDVIEKGYKIDLSKIEEGFLMSEEVCTAPSRNEAKSILLNKVRYDDLKLKRSNELVSYLNIPIVRAKDFDKVLFEGSPKSRHEIDYILATRQREASLQVILDNPDVTHCYIRKHGAYYRPNSCGYTQMISRAGVYEKAKAVKDGISCMELQIIPINKQEHNQMLIAEISELESRLL